jgi:hypothetical protein
MPANYRRAFWKSRHHAWLGVLTLGLGFLSAEPLGLLIGATLYALGLVFLPDTGFFRRAIDRRETDALDQENAKQLAAFQQQQDEIVARLSNGRRGRYQQLVGVCREIEAASTEAAGGETLDLGTRRAKLTELAWTYLRMLAIEQSIEVYLETERRERVPLLVEHLQEETQRLAGEIEAMQQKTPRPAALEGKERLLTSRLERLQSLQERIRKIEQAQANHELLTSEQERLVEQVKLIRADSIASKNADTLTARIDSSIEHLAATNKWISELAEFKDLTGQFPAAAAAALPSVAPAPAHKVPAAPTKE